MTFTVVGYGLQQSFPDAAAWKDVALKIRMVAHPKLNQINVPGFTGNFSLLLSNNAAPAGPASATPAARTSSARPDVVAGVTSFGINGQLRRHGRRLPDGQRGDARLGAPLPALTRAARPRTDTTPRPGGRGVVMPRDSGPPARCAAAPPRCRHGGRRGPFVLASISTRAAGAGRAPPRAAGGVLHRATNPFRHRRRPGRGDGDRRARSVQPARRPMTARPPTARQPRPGRASTVPTPSSSSRASPSPRTARRSPRRARRSTSAAPR